MQMYLSKPTNKDELSAGGWDGDLLQFLQTANSGSCQHSHQAGHVAAIRLLYLDGELLNEDVTLDFQTNPVLQKQNRHIYKT